VDINDYFVLKAPARQNVIDLFDGEWSSGMPSGSGLVSKPGHAPLFEDPRVYWAHDVLGPFDGLNIIELGPLEGAHSFMLEQFGVNSVESVEANSRAFLKCLCIKEVFDLKRVKFVLGDFYHHLTSCTSVDIIFASGVLYHMTTPLELLELICKKSNRLFIWTHYYDQDAISRRDDRSCFSKPMKIGAGYVGVRRVYPNAALNWVGFSGGAQEYAIWLERASLIAFLRNHGFSVEINFEQVDHANGPCMAICARRV
jgi:hypothetical protein